MNIVDLQPTDRWSLSVILADGRTGVFDVKPYLVDEAFMALRDLAEFRKVHNGGYFVEWDCGADLSGDTLEAGLQPAR